MADPLHIIGQLDAGVLTFEQAFAYFEQTDKAELPESGVEGSPHIPLTRGPQQNAAGRILLREPEELAAEKPLTRTPGMISLSRLVQEHSVPEYPDVRSSQRDFTPLPRALAGAPPSETDVVHLHFPEPSIAVVTLQEREHRNMFTLRLGDGLLDVFARIHANDEVKVVLVHGYETWFCSGGTPDELAAIRAGNISFTDLRFFRVLLDCELPTIAAMQGHAIGGGLAFGLYADIILMAEHALFAANFMNHGFTPGMGSTYLIPAKLGAALGTEMLYTARTYNGRELRDRGAPLQILPGAEVIPRAMEIARELADKPRPQLKHLKRLISLPIRRAVAEAVDQERVTHQMIFGVGGW